MFSLVLQTSPDDATLGEIGYHLRFQLAVGPIRRRLSPLCKRARFVSFCSIVMCGLSCIVPDIPPPRSSDIECFGAHLGAPQTANLGDGHGWVNQTIELRNDYGNDIIGTCWESLVGGSHLRLFRQNGPSADTGALFLAYVCRRLIKFQFWY